MHRLFASSPRKPLALLGTLALGSAAFGQSINIDCGANSTFPIPSDTYGAAAAQAGSWNAISSSASGAALVAIDGAPTGVTASVAGAFGNFEFNNASTSGDDQNLLDDIIDVGSAGSVVTLTLAGLADGDYSIYTYAWTPDNPTGFSTNISIAGATGGTQTISGPFSGTHVQGDTYALHTLSISGGGSVIITAATNSGFGSINGVQIVSAPVGPFEYCAPGNGNSISTGGAILAHVSGYGTASATFNILDVPNQPGLMFAGDGMIDAPFGCGRRCVGGTTIRGTVLVPSGNQVLGATFDMSAATSLNIQFWYRDPANLAACGSAFNLSNALRP